VTRLAPVIGAREVRKVVTLSAGGLRMVPLELEVEFLVGERDRGAVILILVALGARERQLLVRHLLRSRRRRERRDSNAEDAPDSSAHRFLPFIGSSPRSHCHMACRGSATLAQVTGVDNH
jgi:hypothetical protein